MLKRIEVADYQSLRRARIRLGWLTVITGPTGSGKSALLRAVELVARNARGSSYVRRGAQRCVVALVEESGNASRGVLIRRGARSTAGDMYKVVTEGLDGTDEQVYTKLASQVPADVARLLRLGPVNFARQLDSPYLLAASGGDIARTLGELTNVATVLAASAEAARRRKGFERDAKNAEARLAGLREQVREYEGLAGRQAAAEQAERAAAGLLAQAEAAGRLRALIAKAEAAGAALDQARRAASASAPPDLRVLEAGLARLVRLRALIAEAENAACSVSSWARKSADAEQARTAADEAAHQVLADAGFCPVCGQKVAA